jgi:hypothetical protein
VALFIISGHKAMGIYALINGCDANTEVDWKSDNFTGSENIEKIVPGKGPKYRPPSLFFTHPLITSTNQTTSLSKNGKKRSVIKCLMFV